MSDPNEHTAFQWAELNKINDTLSTLTRLGFGPGDDAFNAVYKARGAALGKLGLTQARTTSLLKLLVGLSPGTLRLFLDAERGYLVEATESPGARPVYKYVGDDVAERILKGELTHDEFMFISAPATEYVA